MRRRRVGRSADGAGALKTDLLIVGGGLSGGLLALALRRWRPEVTVTLVEAGPTLGGNHVWSFFDSDIAEAHRPLLDPLVCRRWDSYDVHFPGHTRVFRQGYNSIESERLDEVVRAAMTPDSVVTGTAAEIGVNGATLTDGRRIDATGVIDVRGGGRLPDLHLGWQKFLGRMLRLAQPHGLTRPTIMDATVDQAEGYRFVYLLPFDAHRVFVEDTYYTTGPELDRMVLADRIDRYARARGWQVVEVEREEAAALPIAMGGDPAGLWRDAPTARLGMAAGLFHPMTGYSLPDAMRSAALVAGLPDLGSAALRSTLQAHAERTWAERGFYRLLARLLFLAADPPDRWRVMARFYGLGEGLIARFYAGQSTLPDKARVLAGKPPVPLGRAFGVVREKRS